jgi:hypothetical protein
VQATSLLGEQAVLVGARLGLNRVSGASFDVGVDLLASPVSRNPGPYVGDKISRLGRLAGAIRYNGSLVGPLRYDVGATLAAGLFSGTFCGGTDACAGGDPGLYLGVTPDAGVGLSLSDRLGVRVSGGYAVHRFHQIGPDTNGVAVGLGVRFSH